MEGRPAVHPSADVLAAFVRATLDDTTASRILTHLDTCPDCRKAVASMSGGDSLVRLRPAPGRGGTPAPGDTLTAPPDPAPIRAAVANLPPQLAGHPQYEVLRELGRGGMGVVYLARNKAMDRLEVLKVINKNLLDRLGAVERFQREIRSAARLGHANIVTAYSVLQQGELLALAMEYVPGEDLAGVVKARGPLPVPYACYYVQQAALGLQHAFEKGMVHRDVKPHNLMLARDGARHVVKVLDFGLAKATQEKGEDTGLTGEGKMLGTPDYMAPEQTVDAARADTRADIYSLGCTLYYLLTGGAPFTGRSLYEIMQAHHSQEARSLNLTRPEVPEGLAAVVRKMMAKDPAQRYQKPIEVVQALAPFVTQKKVGSSPVPAADEAKTQPQPRTSAVAPPRRPAAGPRPSRKAWLIGGGVSAGVLLLSLVVMWAAGVFKVKTRHGTIVLEDLPADAEVLVDGETVTLKARDSKAITITAGKKHRLEVKKEGFKVFGKEVEIDAGERLPIRVSLQAEAVAAKPPPAKGASADTGFVPLFNGKDLTGWSVDGGPPGQWVMEGNTIVGQSKDYRTRNYLLADKDYADFLLRFEYKVEERSHGGVALRAIEGEKVPLKDKSIFDHPLIKLTNPAMEDREPTGMTHWLRSPTLGWAPVEILTLPTGVWHSMEVTVRGDKCTATVGGKELVNVTFDPKSVDGGDFVPGLGRRKGKVGFQINTGVVRFRNIRIKELPPPATGFVPLFNGKNLTGWKTHPKQPGDWRVEDAILVGSGPATSHLFSERGDYKDFHLRVEARINDGGNSGVSVRTPFGPQVPATNPRFLLGYEGQINSTHGDPNKTGSLYLGGAGAVVSLRESPVPAGEWFTIEMLAEDNRITVKVNGRTTADYTDEKRRFTSGHIAVQQLDAKTVAEFRKIEIKEMK